MKGSFSIEQKVNEEINIILTVWDKREVDMLTLDLMDYCHDVYYEPENKHENYESCLMCSENMNIKIRTKN